MLCLFPIWTRNSAITHKCGQVVLSRTSVNFATSKLTLSFSYSFHVPCIILSNVYFYIVRSICFPFFLIDHNRKQVLLINVSHFCFRRRSIIGQLSLQTATVEKEIWLSVKYKGFLIISNHSHFFTFLFYSIRKN